MRLLIDTNALLDLPIQRGEDSLRSRLFFDLAAQHKNEFTITAMTLRDIGYVAQHYLHDWKKARQIQAQVYVLASKIIDTSADATITSLYEDWEDYEDSLRHQCAIDSTCDAIVTSNKKDFEKAKLPVYSPMELIAYRQ